jgi:hypothetical protein
MAAPTVFVLHGINAPAAFYSQLEDATPANQPDLVTGLGSGHFEPLFRGVRHAKPEVNFRTTQLATLLAQCGVYGQSLGNYTDLYYKSVTNFGTRAGGSTATQLRMNAAFLHWKSITARVQGECSADCSLLAAYDGTNNPIVATGSVALVGTPTAAEFFSLGKVSLNGTVLEGIEDVTIELGHTLYIRGSGAYPSFIAVKEVNPVVTLRGLDLAPWLTAGCNGVPLSSTGLIIYLRKCCADVSGGLPYVADATAQHISFTATNGLVVVEHTGGGGNSEATTGLRIYLRAASSAVASLVFNPATAIT